MGRGPTFMEIWGWWPESTPSPDEYREAPMSKPETIREVARQMREAHGPEHKRHKMWDKMATLLEEITEDFTDEEDYEDNDYVSTAYDVAYEYLTADPG